MRMRMRMRMREMDHSLGGEIWLPCAVSDNVVRRVEVVELCPWIGVGDRGEARRGEEKKPANK